VTPAHRHLDPTWQVLHHRGAVPAHRDRLPHRDADGPRLRGDQPPSHHPLRHRYLADRPDADLGRPWRPTCAAGVCDLGSSTPANDFYFASFSAAGDFTLPLTWTIANGSVPTGTALRPDGILYGVATTIGTYQFTVRVTDANGKTGTQAFTTGIIAVPAAGDPACQRAPSSSNAQLTGPAIGGVTPQGQALGDQSKLTACGGFVTLNISVKNVNLPDGTVLWVTVDRVVGTITSRAEPGRCGPTS
jgi:hypothetical protein